MVLSLEYITLHITLHYITLHYITLRNVIEKTWLYEKLGQFHRVRIFADISKTDLSFLSS